MSAAPPVLPDQLDQAHQLITQLHSRGTTLEAEIQQLKWQVEQLKKQLFGPSADRADLPDNYSKEQALLSLFPPASEPPATSEVVLPVAESAQATLEKAAQRPRRRPEIKVLEKVVHRLEPEEKTCPHCGQEKHEIGCERSERLEYIPAKIIREVIERPKLACSCGQGGVSIAPLPPAPVDKGLPGAGLLAHVCLSKYEDHTPLYRQQKQFERLGVIFPRQTLCDWIAQGAELLQPIVCEMKKELLSGDYLQVDETPVRVMDPDLKGKCAMGYLWVAGRPAGNVIFEFHPGRGKEYALELLGAFKGTLQRDGYGVYGSIVRERPDILPLGCLAHVRRKFAEALHDEPHQAQWFVGEIRKLYLIEAHARDEALSAAQRYQLRQRLAEPIFRGLLPRAKELQTRLLPQSPCGKAINYLVNEWPALQRYLDNGQFEIDNNLTENAIRPSAVGKKNWLFVGHPEAGWRSAVIYSILVSCRRQQIDTAEYLRDVFTRLPAATNQEITQFTPTAWKALRDTRA